MEKRYRHALICGKFAPLHKGHQLLIDTAVAEAGQVTVMVYANPDFPAMPQAVRAGWLRQLYPQVTVMAPDDAPPDASDDATHRAYVRDFLARHGVTVDVVFTSEDYGDGFARVLGVAHRLVDIERGRVPVSGTRVRADMYGLRRFLDPAVYGHFVEKVVVMGAESTGKSTLVAALAQRLGTASVAEYGREVWEARQGQLTLQDYVGIAVEHRRREDAAVMDSRDYLFVDTNALTTLFFSYYYHRGGLAELHALADDCRARYAHVFVCDDDIAFEQDGWRDNAVWRGRLQGLVLKDLDTRGIAYEVVRGTVAARVDHIVGRLGAARGRPIESL